jgi:hypothetical protein
MKLIIAGDRNVTNINVVKRALVKFKHEHSDFKVTEIVSGCARGVDTLGEEIASQHKVAIKRFPADWDKYARAAGPIRNEQMAKYADALCAVLTKDSRGTRNMIERAKKQNLIITVMEI